MSQMKSIYLLVLGLLSLTACSNFLDSEPTSQISDENFYRTKADAEKALIGCYDGLQAVWSGSSVAFPVMSEVCSDNCYGATGNGDNYVYDIIDHFDPSLEPAQKNIFGDTWKAYYKAIYRCNTLISKIGQINWENDDTYRASVEGQVRFLRAFMYFDMVRTWENIPLAKTPSSDNLPQAPVDSVYKLIAEDLKAASEIPGTAWNAAWAATNDGRATKWAAKALLARVFLFYTGYYNRPDLVQVASKNDVLTGLEDVIANGGFSLLDDYATMWPASAAYQKNLNDDATKYAGKGNSETVFAVKYNYTSNYDGKTDGNHWLVMLGLRNNTNFPYSKGWGACTVTPELWNAFSNNDKRKKLSIIDIKGENLTADTKDQRDYTGYSNKKYTPIATKVDGKVMDAVEALGAVNFQIGQYQDYVAVRYADVLLMAAELGSANAQGYFDQVRSRAGLGSRAVTKDNILEERRLEFAFEGIRYWDLLRQGLNMAAQKIAVSTTVSNGNVPTPKIIKAANLIATRGFQQIPVDQITQSGNVLKQNAGW